MYFITQYKLFKNYFSNAILTWYKTLKHKEVF